MVYCWAVVHRPRKSALPQDILKAGSSILPNEGLAFNTKIQDEWLAMVESRA